MLYYLTPAESAYTVKQMLRRPESAGLRERMRSLTFETIFAQRRLPIGGYIFSGLDQLTPTAFDLAVRCYQQLEREVPGARLLNDPRQVLLRHALLQRAFQTGVNTFRAVRLIGTIAPLRFPVFLRSEREHTGSLSGLIHRRSALPRELARVAARGYRLRDLLVVEYCHTADAAGVFRKYSAYVVGDQILPRYLEISDQWVTKDDNRFLSETTVREDLAYVRDNPHGAWLERVSRMANIGYGRVDYGVASGTPQLWEINTCPTIGGPRLTMAPVRRSEHERQLLAPVREQFYRAFAPALQRLDLTGAGASGFLPVHISARETAKLHQEALEHERLRAHDTWAARVASKLLAMRGAT